MPAVLSITEFYCQFIFLTKIRIKVPEPHSRKKSTALAELADLC